MTAQLVLFACTHNSGRSQIANAFFNQLADPAMRSVRSAMRFAGLSSSSCPRPDVILRPSGGRGVSQDRRTQ